MLDFVIFNTNFTIAFSCIGKLEYSVVVLLEKSRDFLTQNVLTINKLQQSIWFQYTAAKIHENTKIRNNTCKKIFNIQ